MSSVQERLQLKRKALDKWSIREKLCLASAVSCSGDQNWMSVSRSLKLLCNSNRPLDWFSQKSCAVQYSDLLENADTPKRKKRTSERDNSYVTETPTESILRKLTQERVAELKALVQQEQEEYAKICEELISIKSGKESDQRIREIWKKIEQEQEQKNLEQQKYAQWLKEREERKLELQRAWRPGTFFQKQPPQQLSLSIIKQDDMDIDETCSRPQGTSPLLSSLLKSTSPAPAVTITSTNVRVTAPTITNLLTGCSNPVTSTPNTPISSVQELSLQSKPLTGPNPQDVVQTQTVLPSPSQSAPTLSMLLENTRNSKEKSQSPEAIKTNCSPSGENKVSTSETWSPNRDDERQLLEVFKGLIPDNIEEFDEILNESNSIILTPELLEEDGVESILDGVESFIEGAEDELETKIIEKENKIVTESKNVSGIPTVTSSNDKELIELKKELISETPKEIKNISNSHERSNSNQEFIDRDNDGHIEFRQNKMETSKVDNSKDIVYERKSEVNSSDESSDNTNLQALKEKIQEEPKTILAEPKAVDIKKNITANIEEDTKIIKAIIDDIKSEIKQEEVDIKNEKDIEASIAEDEQNVIIEKCNESNKKNTEEIQVTVNSETISIVVIPPDENSNEKPIQEIILEVQKEITTVKPKDSGKEKKVDVVIITEPEVKILEPKVVIKEIVFPVVKPDTPVASPAEMDISEIQPTITILDTDEDSTTDVIREENLGKEKRDYSRRKSAVVDKKDDEEVKMKLTVKKLREVDGSESPVVEEDPNDSTIIRTRRRYSSTHATDSIPSSPASIDDRDSKAWRKSLLTYYTRLSSSKNAQIFQPNQSEEQLQEYRKLCYRWVDWPVIKKNIETGYIRTTIEFQRDIMLMCHNAMMIFSRGSANFIMAKDLIAECSQCIDININDTKRDTEKEKEKEKSTLAPSSSSVKVRGSSRKSLRLP